VDLLPKIKLELVLPDNLVNRAVENDFKERQDRKNRRR